MTEAADHEQWQVHYEGRVQGVGFRYITRRIASGYPVTGYVKNLPDGRVLLVAEGQPGQLQRLVEAVATQMGHYVRRTICNAVAATGEFDGFEIRF